MISFLAIVFAFLPGFAWLVFYLQEDLHPEPKKLIALTFLMGAASAIFALFVEITFDLSLEKLKLGNPPSLPSVAIISLLFVALVEEISKFAGAYFSIHKNKNFDEPVDAMIYTMVAALGFATVENLGVLTGEAGKQTALLRDIFETTSLRFVGATLLHALTSSVVGYWWAISIRKFKAKKFLLWGLLLATTLHALFNFLIIIFGNVVYPIILLVIVGFFVLADFEKLKTKTL